MEFKSNTGIYLQIANTLCNQILDGKLKPNERVPSVRDLAAEVEVNRNTVMRAYSYLQDENIFENKRGVGFFVSEKAHLLIKMKNKNEFFQNEMPYLLEKIRLLKLNSTDLKLLISEIKNNDNHENK